MNWRTPGAYRAQRCGNGRFTRPLRSRAWRKRRRKLARESRKRNREK